MKGGPTLKLPRRKINFLRGKTVNVEGEVVGYNENAPPGFKEPGYMVKITNEGNAVIVHPENVESINSPTKGVPCAGCGKIAKLTKEENLVGAHSIRNPEQYVEQNSFRYGNVGTLHTAGLATCSALVVQKGKKLFVAHISSMTDTTIMKKFLINMLKKVPGDLKIEIYAGTGVSANDRIHIENPSEISLEKIMTLLTELGINTESIPVIPVCFRAAVPL